MTKALRGNDVKFRAKWKNATIIVLSISVVELVLRLSDRSMLLTDDSISYPLRWIDSSSNTISDSSSRLLLKDPYGHKVSTDINKLSWDPQNPLAIPYGEAVALPSIRVDENSTESVDSQRKFYGGKGDKAHLGGFTELDTMGISPLAWKYMITNMGIHSVLDIGCGRGISTAWFYLHGCDVLCAEGSHDALMNTVLPYVKDQAVEHDFSRGPWWPAKTYDAVWAVEFLEHVGVQFHFNYMTAFRKAALIFVSSSIWGGWHHVEVHPDEWWIRKYEMYGLRYDNDLTQQIRQIAVEEKRAKNGTAPNGKFFNAQYIYGRMKVFVNPVVAALPQHAHLFPAHGCYENRKMNRVCGTGKYEGLETPLPKEFWPLELKPEMDDEWDALIKQHISSSSAAEQ